MLFPKTRKEDLVETIHGRSVADPFRWLEDGASSEVKEWAKEQNDFLWQNLDRDMFERVSKELVETFHTTNYGVPVKRGEKYFFTKRLPGQDQTVLYYKNDLNGEEIVLVDPNAKGSTVSLDFWNPSRNGKYVAYGLSSGGDEMATIYIVDVAINKHTTYEIPRCRHSVIRWIDDSQFYYTRNPREGTVPEHEAHLHTKVYLHVLGQDPLEDRLIFGADRAKDDMYGLSLSVGGRFLSIQVMNNWTHNDIFVYDNETGEATPLIQGIKSRFTLFFSKDRAFIYTNYKANNFRLLVSDFSDFQKPIDEWAEAVAEQNSVLENVWFTRNKLILGYLVNASSKVEIRDHSGNPLGDLDMPPFSTLQGISTNREYDEFFYSVSSYTFPSVIYRYDPASETYSTYIVTENPITPEEYKVTQEWFASKDGTKVPIFIIRRNDLETSPQPTILYGYGGYGVNMTPEFMRAWMVGWISHGGVFVVANIRGGGEFGEAWHKAAMLEKKQNSFDDFIGAAEYLISQNYTSREKLGIMGGSNGGRLVSTCGIQRPDLYGAIVSAVPLTDMIRYHTSSGPAMRWVKEYGNPDVAEDFEYLISYSPYHNVKDGIEYPPSLYLTSENDTRVNPYHARKMAAMLQSVNKENLVLLYSETDAGHGGGKPVKKIIENTAIRITFLAQQLGLKL